MENLDGTILATALPSMARSFRVPASDVAVAITAYLLTVALFIPVSGWLSQRWGARRIFCAAILTFTVASVLCAASSGVASLTASRVLQGAGGAMMVPVGREVVLRSTAKADVVRAIAFLTWPALIAPIIAPLLGGVLSDYASWRYIFILNVPLGILTFFFARRLVPRSAPSRVSPLDVPGFCLVALALCSAVLTSTALQALTIRWGLALTLFAVSVLAALLSRRHLRVAAAPLLDLSMFAIASFRLSHLGGAIFRATINAVPFLVPLMLQEAFGWSAVKSGSILLFLFVGNLGIKPATTGLLRRFGFRPVLVAASAGAVISMLSLAALAPSTPLPLIVIVMIFSGVTRSVGFTAYNSVAFADVSSTQLRAANTLSSSVQQAAIGFGVALGALALRFGQFLVGGHVSASAPGAYRIAFLVIAVLTLPAVIEALRANRGIGATIRPA